MQGLRNAFLQNQPNHTNPPATRKNQPKPENEIALNINDLATKTHETTGNKPENPESFLHGLRNAFLQNQPNHPHPPSTSKNQPKPENEIAMNIKDLATKTHETTGNKPENPESFLQGLRNAFLQHQPNYPHPPSTSKNQPKPENEITLNINELNPKTHETTGN